MIKKSSIKYHYTHIYLILRKWEFKQKVTRKVHINTASLEEKFAFKKKTEQIFVDKQQQQENGLTIGSLDESFFFYDSLIRRVRIDKNKKPVVRMTGHTNILCVFGAVSIDGKKKQLFRQYDKFNGNTFLDCLKKIHTNSKFYLFMDKASPHYKSNKVLQYFIENKNTLILVYLPTASPELW